jgi:YbbR domain-containing protein
VTRVVGVILHNWPLKLAAVGLATLLYGGLVLSQNTQTFLGVIPVHVEEQPPDTFLLTAIEPVTEVRYFSATGARPITSTFEAVVDLSGVVAGTGPQVVPISVRSVDERIQVLGSEPDVATVQLDTLATRDVPVVVNRGSVPEGLEVGEATVEPTTVEVSGPASVVEKVVSARADVVIQSTGIDVDQDVTLVPVDGLGNAVSPVNLEPTTARVRIPVFSDRESRTVPVTPVVTGTPAPGFEVAGVTVDPPVVTVEGDADQLAELVGLETEPVSVNAASSQQRRTVELVLPDGVVPLGQTTVLVTVDLRAVTETRSFSTGVRVVGDDPGLTYQPSTDRVLLVIGGGTADLDRLDGSTLVADLDVSDLGVGQADVPVTVELPAGLNLVSVSPATVRVTVGAVPTPTPAAVQPSPTPSVGAGG